MQNYIEGGYFFLARKIVDSSIFSKPPLYFKVWIYLLSRAQHSDYKGLKRGQLYTSIPEIIDATSWKVGFRTEKPTKDQIFQVLNWLRKSDEGGNESNVRASMIATTKATHGLLVTICNYNVYQDSSNYESNGETDNEKVMKPQRKQQRSDNINKNVKNDNNDNNDKNVNKNISSNQDLKERFEIIWKEYPNKKGKDKAFKSYQKAIKNGVTDNVVLNGIHRYKEEIKFKRTEQQFVAHGSTWFNQNRWDDEYEQAPNRQMPSYEVVDPHYKNEDVDISQFDDELPF